VRTDGNLPITPRELGPPLVCPPRARDRARRGGFADAVGAGPQQRFPRADRKAQSAEDLPAPPDAGKVGPDEPHHLATPDARGRCAPDPRCNPTAIRAPLTPSLVRTGSGKIPDSMPMSLASADFLEWRKKSPYKPSSRADYQPALGSRPGTGGGASGSFIP